MGTTELDYGSGTDRHLWLGTAFEIFGLPVCFGALAGSTQLTSGSECMRGHDMGWWVALCMTSILPTVSSLEISSCNVLGIGAFQNAQEANGSCVSSFPFVWLLIFKDAAEFGEKYGSPKDCLKFGVLLSCAQIQHCWVLPE